MSKRIMFLNIFRGHLYDADYQAVVDAAKADGTVVDVWSFPQSKDGSEGDYLHQVKLHRYESLTLADTLSMVRKAEKAGYDATVIGCFNDPALVEAREVVSKMVVVAPCEASLHIATTLGRRFGILVVRNDHIPQMEENITRYGFADRLASFRAIGISTENLQQDPDETARRLIDVARHVVEADRADVLLLGCTNYFGLYERIQEAVGVPVLDPIITSLKFAELLVELRQRFGWQYRRVIDMED